RPTTHTLFPYTTLFRSQQSRFLLGDAGTLQIDLFQQHRRRNNTHRGSGVLRSGQSIGDETIVSDGVNLAQRTYGQRVGGCTADQDRKSTRLNSSHEWIS